MGNREREPEQASPSEDALELHSSGRFLQAILDALTAHIAVLDETGRIIAVNAAWRRFAVANGLRSPACGLGANYLAVSEAATGPDAATGVATAAGIRDVLAGERAEFVLEYPCHAPTEERWFIVRATRLASSGTPRVVIAHENITPRKQAEHALLESEARFRTMADESPVIIWATDAGGGIEFVNRAYRRFFGVTEEQVRGPNWQPLVHPADAAAYVAAFQAALRERRPFHAEARVRRADGVWRWIESVAAPRLSPTGELRGMVGSSPDITDRKQTEEDRVAFVDAVAHDVKNPLAAAKGRVQLLRRRLQQGEADPVRLDAGLGEIGAAVERAVSLVEEMLDAAHLRSGRLLELEPAPVDLVALAAAARSAQDATTLHTIRVESALPSLIGIWDESRLRRVLGNLLGNACKYSPAGGEIVVRLARDGDGPNATAVLTVSDEGIGIPAADLPTLFERFQRGSNVASITGRGIGLAGVRQIIEQHGGSIGVGSVEGRGSTFTVRLPLSPPAV